MVNQSPSRPSLPFTTKQFTMLFIIISFAIGGWGGYLLGAHKIESFSKLMPLHMPSSPTNQRQSVTSFDWKTYADLKNGFSLDYPRAWNQLILANDSVAFTPEIPHPFYASDTFQIHPGALITVANDNDKKLRALDYVQQKVINVNEYSRNAAIKTKLSTVDGVIVSGLISPQSGEEVKMVAYIINGSKVIGIIFDPTAIENGEQIFSYMLSTLKVWAPQQSIH